MDANNNYYGQSLQELDGEDWGDMQTGNSFLVNHCLALRRIPLNELMIEDLRILIGQRIGLAFLLPLAIVFLKENIFAEGDYYPGDLLQNVLSIGDEFWLQHPKMRQIIQGLIAGRESELQEQKIGISRFTN